VYGPGSQILTYQIMAKSRRFDIVSFRSAFAVFNFVALLVVGIAAYWWLGIVGAVGVVLLAETYSSIAFYYTPSDGTFAGFYGWSNPVRYLAPVIIVPPRAAVVGPQASGERARAGPPWRRLGYRSVVGARKPVRDGRCERACPLPSVAHATVSLSRATRLLVGVAAGLALVVVPIPAYYAARGRLERLSGIISSTHAAAMGFSNTWWPPQNADLPERNFVLFHAAVPASPRGRETLEARAFPPLRAARVRSGAFSRIRLRPAGLLPDFAVSER
jgi:hypothetical protein